MRQAIIDGDRISQFQPWHRWCRWLCQWTLAKIANLENDFYQRICDDKTLRLQRYRLLGIDAKDLLLLAGRGDCAAKV